MRIYSLFISVVILSMVACGSEDTTQKNLLIGHWDLTEGQRNGKITESLNGTYFEFTEADKMSTNLPIKGGIDSPYVIENGQIVQTIINDLKIRYKIESLNGEDLTLTTKLRNFDFVFSLKKRMDEKLEVLSSVDSSKK